MLPYEREQHEWNAAPSRSSGLLILTYIGDGTLWAPQA